MQSTPTRRLICGALLTTVVPLIEHNAHADPVTMEVSTCSYNKPLDNLISVATSLHTFGTMTTHADNPGYPVHFESGYSGDPDWQYFITFDFSDYAPEDWIPLGYNRLGIYMLIEDDNGPAQVLDGIVKDGNGNELEVLAFEWPGPAYHDNVIGVFVFAQPVIDAGYIVTVYWNQIPSPSALALLGLAGIVSRRRRRY